MARIAQLIVFAALGTLQFFMTIGGLSYYAGLWPPLAPLLKYIGTPFALFTGVWPLIVIVHKDLILSKAENPNNADN